MVFKSNSKYKIELFFISFYVLTGNINDLLTVKIPGFSLFEIQPIRFIYLMLLFFIVRKTWFSKERFELAFKKKIPWFVVFLFVFVMLLIISVLVNSAWKGPTVIVDAIAFVIIMMALRQMADKASYDLIGKSIIIGAVVSSVLSFVQLLVEPFFLRIGGDRLAYDGILRSNGLFSGEYNNAYFLIIAITWTLTTVKKRWLKMGLVCLFSLGVMTTFHRMSWIILALVILTYLIFIKKMALEKLALAGMSFSAIIISIFIFHYQDIMKSDLVKERLNDSVGGREGYYTMVLDNFDKRPLFGYGDFKNEVYYTNLLRITTDRKRATAETGGLHNGYLTTLFLYGIPALICFTLFVLFSVFYYARSYQENLYFVIPFLVSIIFMIGNLTNTFLFLSYLSVLFAIHIGIGMGINQIRETIGYHEARGIT